MWSGGVLREVAKALESYVKVEKDEPNVTIV